MQYQFKTSRNGVWNGRKHSLDTIQKMKKSKNVGLENPQYGTCWITNGIENKKIKKTEIILNGWYFGRIIKKT